MKILQKIKNGNKISIHLKTKLGKKVVFNVKKIEGVTIK